ncbi:MAG: hypothetical protein GF416_00175 [Candidatus Altiarchaeales archaeon]|nr:hypothetical protein [Candidatus Altiarchaeales archaeon]MBD3415537.1 hypothetical protein [Candidatus Altiarchaeales archaeon]
MDETIYYIAASIVLGIVSYLLWSQNTPISYLSVAMTALLFWITVKKVFDYVSTGIGGPE